MLVTNTNSDSGQLLPQNAQLDQRQARSAPAGDGDGGPDTVQIATGPSRQANQQLEQQLNDVDGEAYDDRDDEDVDMEDLDEGVQEQLLRDYAPDEEDEEQAKEDLLSAEGVLYLGPNPGSNKVKKLRSQLQDGCFPKMGIGRRSSAQKKDLQNKKVKAMNIPSARLTI